MAINPNEAPPGCIAVAAAACGECEKCCMYSEASMLCELIHTTFFPCGEGRKDRGFVRFERHDGTATASWPYDDMGTPVEVVS